jgi:2-oxoglutarate ferredoxin oxidoreductase subunit alpha
MTGQKINILFGGEAGQGLQTVGPILARCLVRKGFSVHVTQTYESRVRGGHNIFAIRVGEKKISAPCDRIDLLICMNEESFQIHRDELTDDALIIGNEEWDIDDDRWIGLPFKMFGEKLYWNMAVTGIAAGLIGLDQESMGQVIDDTMKSGITKENKRVLAAAYKWLEEKENKFKILSGINKIQKKWMLTGHEAVALGAISGGIKFCSFYPMSPATSIAQTLINHSQKMGLIVEQVEDEIAAINMALGASFAGVPSIVPTSGGGFALMTEGLSLSGISETPVVIVIAQRPGPGTGLATRTEQGDLWHALHSGHGEFPRVIYAPGNVEECFFLTRKAVEMTETYQVPAIILTDQYIAESFQDMDQIDIETLPFIKPGADASEISVPYNRYWITKNGISPRLLPGLSKQLVIGDSHEHTELGHMTEDLTLRPRMVDKRLKKGDMLKDEAVLPEYKGSKKPEILFVCWGSVKGAVEESAEMLKSDGKKAATLHFSQVWPLYPDNFLKYLENVDRVIAVEGNATGQFAQLIRRESGFLIENRISRYDGLPITPDFIMGRTNR